MKKNVIKTAFAAVCVVAAGMGGLKAYNVADQSKVDMLLAQNVDALSSDNEAEAQNVSNTYWDFTNDTKLVKINGQTKPIKIDRCKARKGSNAGCSVGEWRYNFARS